MNKSYWVESTPKTNYPNISEDIDTDVLIIGGGITGILTAYMLSESGLNISIVEADKMALALTGEPRLICAPASGDCVATTAPTCPVSLAINQALKK